MEDLNEFTVKELKGLYPSFAESKLKKVDLISAIIDSLPKDSLEGVRVPVVHMSFKEKEILRNSIGAKARIANLTKKG